jgi:hypothetical protein
MMFVMVTNVEVKVVADPIIRIGLLSFDELIMLSDEVTSTRMQSQAQERADDHVEKSLVAPVVHNDGVKCELSSIIHELPFSREVWLHNTRSNSIEQRLKEEPNELLEAVVEDVDLKLSRDISINAIHTLELMMLHVVESKGHSRGNSSAQIGKKLRTTVTNERFKSKVVR